MSKARDPNEAVELSVDLLRADARNARKIREEAFDGLNFSMGEFGDLSGIVWNEQLGDLAAGHVRMKALRAAGAKTWTRTPDGGGYIVDPRTGERFTIRVVRWDEPRHRAAQLLANNPHIRGEYTADAVAQLRALEGQVAFGSGELDKLLDQLADDEKKSEPGKGLEEFDAEPKPKPSWVTIAAPADIAAEIESLLRGRYEGDSRVRIEAGELETHASRQR